MKNATAINHGNKRLLATARPGGDAGDPIGSGGLRFVGLGSVGLRRGERCSSIRDASIITDTWFEYTRATSLVISAMPLPAPAKENSRNLGNIWVGLFTD